MLLFPPVISGQLLRESEQESSGIWAYVFDGSSEGLLIWEE